MELLTKIASWSLREFAISWRLALPSITDYDKDGHKSEHGDSLVDLSLPLYTRYITIDWIVYLEKLRNSSFPGCRQRSDGKKTAMQAAFYVDVGNDDLGVRCLRIISTTDAAGNAAVPPGLWCVPA